MDDALAEDKLNAQMLLQVHDELIFEVSEGEVKDTIAVVKEAMESAPHPAVARDVQVDARAADIGTRRGSVSAHSRVNRNPGQ